jgi:NitT/TauT family transport system substrate-binding protein
LISAAILTALAAFAAVPGPAPLAQAVPSAGGGPLTPVTIAYAAISASQAGAWVAKEEGIFAKHGLDATLTSIPGGSSPTAALISGKIDALQISVEAIEADLAGADIVYVAAPLSVPTFSFVTQPSITDPRQLKGQRVAMTGFGTATYYAAVIALRHFGLDPFKDVVLVRTGSLPAMVDAMKSGQIQAGAFSLPTLAEVQAAGMRVMVNVADLGIRYPSSWLTVTRAYAQAHRPIVAAMVASITEAIAFEQQHPARTIAVIAQYAHISDPNLLAQTYRAVILQLNRVPLPAPSEIRQALDLIAIRNPEAKGADPARFVDTSFVVQLEKDGFIDRLYKTPAGP